jgi:6-phosphogluconolactonase
MLKTWDERRHLAILDTPKAAVQYAAEHWLACAQESVKRHGSFYVALSGGSTPKAIFETLTRPPFKELVPWKHIHLFWGDERAVPPDHPDSNYRMAMKAGLEDMPIPPNQIHRMVAEKAVEDNALAYEAVIHRCLSSNVLDLVMLGMGEDGHTASLFPHTKALHIHDRLVAANYVPQIDAWRMTLTFPCLETAKHTAIYVLGEAKKKRVAEVLKGPYKPDDYPIQRIGTPQRPALWVLDSAASSLISYS